MLHSGRRLGDRYRLDDRIGAGGMGEVWRAVDEVLGRVVAVKAMLPQVADEPGFARRFLVEAKAMASVNHPAVASIHDFGTDGGITFLVMEFIDGESLAQVLARVGRLDPADTMRLVAEAAEGLRAVHECGIVHRDIKPANLLIRRNGSLLITDFGISRTEDATHLTVSGAVLGTPTYLSPEQVLGRPATARSDLYSLGLTAYECLAGHRPFVADNPYAMALQRVQSAPRPLSGDLPAPVLAVVARALAGDPADRWPSAAALAEAARAAAQGRPAPDGWPVAGHPPTAGTMPRPADPARPGTPAPWGPDGSDRSGPPPAHHFPAAGGPGPAGAEHSPGAGPSGAHRFPPAGGAAGRAGVSAPARRTARRWSVVAALLGVALVGGATTWWVAGQGDAPRGGATGRSGSAPGEDALRQAGFAPCGDAYCPTRPVCFAGLTSISGNAMPPRRVECTGEHAWETFSAIRRPADAADLPQDELMARDDVQAACAAPVMAARSGDRSTTGWIREAWPVQVSGTELWLVHCLARPPEGNPVGSTFSTS
jgi:eukaryotic-like serine/threonine-protein kinase